MSRRCWGSHRFVRLGVVGALAACAAIPAAVNTVGAVSSFVPLAVSASVSEVRAEPFDESGVVDVSCATATACVIAATPSVRTLDGGATWQPFKAPNSLGELTAVHCSASGLCLGANQHTVVRSVDFGVSWVISSTQLLDTVRSFDCATPTSCVAVGFAAAGQPAVATSTDGGVTWTRRTSAVNSELGRVVCPSSSLCVAVGVGGVMSSTNAGVTWAAMAAAPTPSFGDALDCAAPSTCAYLAGAAIEVTNDGATWTAMPVPSGRGPFDLITCASSSRCIAASRSTGPTQRFDPTSRTFTVEPAFIGFSVTNAMDCLGLTCVRVDSTFGVPLRVGVVTGRSLDGGDTWSADQAISVGGTFAALDCIDATHCVAVGRQTSAQAPFAITSQVVSTADAGATWQQQTAPSDLSLGLYSVACIPATTACVTTGTADPTSGRIGIDRSVDGGATWHPATADVPLRGFSDVRCFVGDICMANGLDMSTPSIGDRSVVLRSTDRGATWQSSNPVEQSQQHLTCQSASTCMLVSFDRVASTYSLTRTVDGGATWTPASWPVPGVDYVYSLECDAAACVGTFYTPTGVVGGLTTDAGLTWTTPSAQVQPDLFGPVPRCTPALCLSASTFNFRSEIRTWSGTGAWDLVATSPATGMRSLVCPQPTVCLALATSGVTFGSAIERISINAVPVGTVSGVQPARLLETRVGPGLETVDHLFQGIGLRPAGGTLVLQVAGRGGVPANAASAMLNVTVTEATKPGFVTVYPCDQARPVASNVNFLTGSTVANSVPAKLAPDGTVCIFTQQATHMVVDVGAFVPGDSTSVVGLPPARLFETRRGPGLVTVDHRYEGVGALFAGAVVPLPVAGRGGVPQGAKAVVLNVTVTEAKGPGFITVFPCDAQRPVASNVNYTAGQTVPNTVYAKLDSGGNVCVYSMAATHLVVDVDAYMPGTGSYVLPLVPARLLETRGGLTTIDNLFNEVGRIAAHTSLAVQVAGRGGVPVGATTAMLNVTVTEPTAPGFVTVYPCDQPVPLASNVNYVAGATVANAVVAKLAPNGTVCVFSSAATHSVVDVNAFIP